MVNVRCVDVRAARAPFNDRRGVSGIALGSPATRVGHAVTRPHRSQRVAAAGSAPAVRSADGRRLRGADVVHLGLVRQQRRQRRRPCAPCRSPPPHTTVAATPSVQGRGPAPLVARCRTTCAGSPAAAPRAAPATPAARRWRRCPAAPVAATRGTPVGRRAALLPTRRPRRSTTSQRPMGRAPTSGARCAAPPATISVPATAAAHRDSLRRRGPARRTRAPTASRVDPHERSARPAPRRPGRGQRLGARDAPRPRRCADPEHACSQPTSPRRTAATTARRAQPSDAAAPAASGDARARSRNRQARRRDAVPSTRRTVGAAGSRASPRLQARSATRTRGDHR